MYSSKAVLSKGWLYQLEASEEHARS